MFRIAMKNIFKLGTKNISNCIIIIIFRLNIKSCLFFETSNRSFPGIFFMCKNTYTYKAVFNCPTVSNNQRCTSMGGFTTN